MAIVLGWLGLSAAITALGHFSHVEAIYNAGAVMLLLSFTVGPSL